jgi:hypothetical protein
MKDYSLTTSGISSIQSTKNISINSVTEDCSIKAGGKMNIRSDQKLDMHSESATIDISANNKNGAINLN